MQCAVDNNRCYVCTCKLLIGIVSFGLPPIFKTLEEFFNVSFQPKVRGGVLV